jgi:hypothetical protein
MKRILFLLFTATLPYITNAQGKPYGGPPCCGGASRDSDIVVKKYVPIGSFEGYDMFLGSSADSVHVFLIKKGPDIYGCYLLGKGRLSSMLSSVSEGSEHLSVLHYSFTMNLDSIDHEILFSMQKHTLDEMDIQVTEVKLEQ